jgi:hypothetical protein
MYVPKNDPNHIDDVDLIGVILGRPEHYLGLHEWGSRGTHEYKRGKYDCVFYEIRKMFALLLQGNPNVLSTLWCRPNHYLSMSSLGRRLIDNRQLFIGKHVYNAFAGYAHAQLEKMETRDPEELREYLAVTAELKYRGKHPNKETGPDPIPQPPEVNELSRDTSAARGFVKNAAETSTEKLIQRLAHFQKKGENIGYMGDKRKQLVLENGYDSKNAAHCIRLLRMCKEFLATGALTVFRVDDSAELLDIKRGKWALSDVKSLSAELFADIKIARDASSLPPEPDRQGAERLLVEILSEHLGL